MTDSILEIVKARLDRSDYLKDEYLKIRIEAAVEELQGLGIYVSNTPRDVVFVADYVCWQYSNREKNEPMPEWLKLQRRERWLAEK